jgi:DNA-binding SARP family transcriptional activator
MVRGRVQRLFERAAEHRLSVVTAPAGFGKSTEASLVYGSVERTTSWYRTEPRDHDAAVLLRHLQRAVDPELAATAPVWQEPEDVALFVERLDRATLLIVDEYDRLIGSSGEQAVEAVVDALPDHGHVLLLTRRRPEMNLTRLAVEGAVFEVSAEDLRFRGWEIDALFRDHYQQPLTPMEIAELERRTGGWAAGLRLFHLATRNASAAERRNVLGVIGRRTWPGWEYVTQNVIAGLPEPLVEFLVETVPLGRLSAPLCDELRGRSDSAQLLGDLERHELFVTSYDEGQTFRCHEVLRSHLDGLLLERLGEQHAAKRYLEAAELLERHHAVSDAAVAYARAAAWDQVQRLMGQGEAQPGGSWSPVFESRLAAEDPWLLLAEARRHRGEGRLREAVATYQRVEEVTLTSGADHVARHERLVLASLVAPSGGGPVRWVVDLRDGLRCAEPLLTVTAGDDAGAHLAAGVRALVAGIMPLARRHMKSVVDGSRTAPALDLAARMCLELVDWLSGEGAGAAGRRPPGGGSEDLDALVLRADQHGGGWLTRLSRAIQAAINGDRGTLDVLRRECAVAGDESGSLIVGLLGLVMRPDGRPDDEPSSHPSLVSLCRAVGVPALESWVVALEALEAAERHRPDAAELAAAAEAMARRCGTKLARGWAFSALSRRGGPPQREYARLAAGVAQECGLADWVLRVDHHGAPEDLGGEPAGGSRVAVRCLGGFEIRVDGRRVDLGVLRPRARQTLRLLAMHRGGSIHREHLGLALWPDADEAAAQRRLQVAVSAARQVLAAGSGATIVRDGDSYRLVLPPGATHDVVEFEAAVAAARTAGDADAQEAAWRTAVSWYRGELLPEDGAAEWVVAERDRHRLAAAQAAECLAALQLARGDVVAAADTCEAGLKLDRYHDPLWRSLLAATSADSARHATVQERYGAVLVELGLEPPRG